MAGLVEQLQIGAMDASSSVSGLLRQVKVAAVKLKLDDAIEWVDAELNGYAGRELPEYRTVMGQPKALDPHHGWLPIHAEGEFFDAISKTSLREPITSLEKLLDSQSGFFTIRFPQNAINMLNQANHTQCGEMAVHIGTGALVNIVERVRTLVLDWALNLERLGITGEGISFTAEEKKIASAATINIHAFHGNFHQGEISGTNARANLGATDNSRNRVTSHNVLAQLEQEISQHVDDPDKSELIGLVRELAVKEGSNEFIGVYQRFMVAAANHMTVLAPFLPALAGLIPG